MRKAIVILVIGQLILGCSKLSNNNPPPNPAPPVHDTEFCGAAEAHLTTLCQADPNANSYCCQVVAPTALQKSFAQVCIEIQDSGVFLNPKCLSEVNSCDQIDKCRSGQ